MRKVILSLALMLPFLMLFSGCGGNDEVVPSSTLTDAPDTLFFNTINSATTSDRVRFSGTASDNFSIFQVQISFDDGSTWKDATVSGTGSSKTWTYLATESVPSAASTLKTRAQDKAGNWETPGAGTAYTKTSSPTLGSLQSIITSATADDVIYLSSGTGGAYGDSSTATVLENSVDLTIVGSGYGQALTTSSFSAVDVTPLTAIASSRSSSHIFSVGANLTLKNLRISSSINAVDISDNAGTVTFEDLVFEDLKAWAIYAEDTNAADSTTLYVSTDNVMIDATDANLANLRGGIYISGADIDFLIKNTLVKDLTVLTSSEEGGGMFVENSDGQIDSSVFSGNAVGIWFKNSSAVLSSSTISGGGSGNSNGIRMSGAGGSPDLRRNTISGNVGYDVKVGGSATPIFYRNTVSSTGTLGVLVDGPNAVPNLGAFPFSSSGCNQFLRNLSNPFTIDPVVSVAETTNNTAIINAGSNFWGFITYTGTQVHTFRIEDGFDAPSVAGEVDLSGTGVFLSPDLWNGVASCP